MSRGFTSTMTWFHVESINYPSTEGTPLQFTLSCISYSITITTYRYYYNTRGVYIHIYVMIIFLGGGRDLVSIFLGLGLSMGYRNWNFSVKSLRSSAVFGGRLQRPSPGLILSEPRREHAWRLSETGEKLQKCCIWRRSSRAFGCILTSAASAERSDL